MEMFSLVCTEESQQLFDTVSASRPPFEAADLNVPGPLIASMGKPGPAKARTAPPASSAVHSAVARPFGVSRLRKRSAAALEDDDSRSDCGRRAQAVRSSRCCLSGVPETVSSEASPCSEASTQRVSLDGAPADSPSGCSRPTNLDDWKLHRHCDEAVPGHKLSGLDEYYFRYLQRLEDDLSPGFNFLPSVGPPDLHIADHMRTKLIDWLAEVTSEFSLRTETLFLGVSLVDRYLAAVPRTCRNELQLVGTACLWLAAKYEETDVLPAAEFVEVAANSFSVKELADQAKQVSMVLEWRMETATPWTWLMTLNKVLQLDRRVLVLAEYLVELSLLDYSILAYKPSTRAAAAINLAALCLGKKLPEADLEFLESNCALGIVPAVQVLHCWHVKVWFQSDNSMIGESMRSKYEAPSMGEVADIRPADLAGTDFQP
eukprot:jgi/Tetstr1/446076/TSEL_033677.t1